MTEGDFKDLWSIALEEKKQQDGVKSDGESHVLFVGSRNAGKTTLILRFLEREEPPKPTTALDYTYGRKSKGANMVKDVSHIWELGGGTFLSKLIEIPITSQTINKIAVVIVLDLSRPEELWDTLETFVNELHTRVAQIYSELKSTRLELVTQLKEEGMKKYGDNHPDQFLTPLPFPMAIIGTKYDLFQEFDPEKKKIISKTLRFVAHSYGASLLYFSNKSDSLINRARQLITHYAFGGPSSHSVSMDHNKPLIVPVGSDALGQIGVPSLSSREELGKISAKVPFDLWKEAYCGFYPQISNDTQVAEDPCKDSRYKEPLIDAMRKQKDEELEKYRHKCERKTKLREQQQQYQKMTTNKQQNNRTNK